MCGLDAERALHGVGSIVNSLAGFLLARLDCLVGGVVGCIGSVVGSIGSGVLGIGGSTYHSVLGTLSHSSGVDGESLDSGNDVAQGLVAGGELGNLLLVLADELLELGDVSLGLLELAIGLELGDVCLCLGEERRRWRLRLTRGRGW